LWSAKRKNYHGGEPFGTVGFMLHEASVEAPSELKTGATQKAWNPSGSGLFHYGGMRQCLVLL
jgi:hypothetical protein